MLAKSKKTLEELNKKYGISGNNTKPTSTKSEKKKQNNSSAPSLDDLNKKYGIGEKSNTKKATPTSTIKTPTTKPSTTLSGETNKTSFATETKNAYTNAKNKVNSKTTLTSNLSDEDRKARIKEIDSELTTLGYRLRGMSTSNVPSKYKSTMAQTRAETEKKIEELNAEKKSLERVGTFSATELKDFEIQDAKAEKAKLPNYNPTARIMPHQVESFKQNVQAHSEADKEIDLLKGQKGLYENISKFGDVVNNDDFGGQWRANYRYADLTRDADKAMNEYLINPTEENRQIAYAYDAFIKEYAKNNEKALDDENVKASWLTKSMAGYLPQFRDQLVPELLGGGIGYLIAGKAGSSIGAGLGSYSQMYDVMRGSVYRTLLAEGVDEQTALEAAEDEALLSALIEGGGTAIGWALSGGGKALEAIGNAATKSVAKGSTNAATKYVANKFLTTTAKKASESALKMAGKVGLGVVGNALSEYGEEFAQQGVSIANKERILNGSDEGLLSASGKVIKDAVTGKNSKNFAEMHEAGTEGFKIGLMFGGANTVVNNSVSRFLNAKTIQEQNEALDFVRNDEETLDTLIEEAKASGEGTVSEKIATEIEKAREKGKEVTRDQVKRLIASNDVYIKNEEAVADYTEQTNEPDLMEAAMETVENRNKQTQSRKRNATVENLDALTADNQPITVDEVKQVTGFGVRGANVVTDLANRDGVTFSQAVNMVESSYLAGATGMTLEQVEGQLRDELQKAVFEAGKEDRVLQDAQKQAQVQNVTTYEGVFHENEHTKNYTEAEKKLLATTARIFKMDISAVDEIIANTTLDEYGEKVHHYANAKHDDGAIEIANRRQAGKVIYKMVMHEAFGHRVNQLAPTEFGVVMNALYQRAKAKGRGYDFDYVRDQHNKAGLEKNTRDNIEEVAVRELETILKSPEEVNKWLDEISQNQEVKNNWQKFVEWINKIFDDIKRAWAQLNMTAEEKADVAEVEHILSLLTDAVKVAEKTATELSNKANAKQDTTEGNNSTEAKNKGDKGKSDFSLIDSEGNTLTESQQEYFKDSKERDENGNLNVMYRGDRENVEVFDRKKSSYSNLYGRGFYFTKSKAHASQYGNTRAYYLDIKHPVSTTETTITKPQLRKFLEAVIDNEDYSFENYGYGATIDSVLNSIYGKSDFLMLNDISQTAIGDLVEAIELFNEVNGTDYDGFILDTETVIFNSEQAKLTTNKNPTSNPNVNFSLIDTVEETKDLIAVHNVREDKLLESLKLGGLPSPSIAITKKDMSHDKFGDISLVFRKETISPTDRRNKIYSGDAYTPTSVRVEYDVDDDVVQEFNKRLKDLTPEWGNERLPSVDAGTADVKNDSLYEAYERNDRAKLAFLREKGKAPKLAMRTPRLSTFVSNDTIIALAKAFSAKQLNDIANTSEGVKQYKNAFLKVIRDNEDSRFVEKGIYSADEASLYDIAETARTAARIKENKYKIKKEVDNRETYKLIDKKFTKALKEEYRAWIDENTKDAIVDKGIRNNRDLFTPSGNRRSFKQLHDPYNLSNIIKQMFSGEEKGIALFGGSPFGAAQYEYSSIADVKADSGRLQQLEQEEHDKIKSQIEDDLFELAYKMQINSDVFAIRDLLTEAIGKKTKQQADAYLRRESQGWAKYSPEFANKLWDIRTRILNMPTEYFEAKPQRAVGFNEVALAVLPKGMSTLRSQLMDAGVQKVVYYDKNKEGDRLKKINSVPDVNFSLIDTEPRTTSNYYTKLTEIQKEINQVSEKIRLLEASDSYGAVFEEAMRSDEGIAAYEKWAEESGYNELYERKDSLLLEYSNLQTELSKLRKKEAIEEERKAIEKSGLSEADYFRKKAVKEFGYTPYFYDAGYITPNGKMLNFSGEKGKHFGARGQDHRAIGIVYESVTGGKAMAKFMSEGNVRIMAESPGIDITSSVEPSAEQYTTIKKFVRECANKEYFNVDFTDAEGYTIGNYQYEGKVSAERIVNDIKYFFETGTTREQSSVSRFHYSLMDTETKTSSKDTKALLETIEHLKSEFKVTKFAKADPKKLAKLTKDLLKEYSSKGIYDETYKAIDELYQYIANGEDKHPAVWEDVYSRASEIAKSIIESAVVVDDEMYVMYKDLRDYLRKTPMKFDSAFDSVPSSYENFREFKRRNWGRLNFTNDGVGVDGVYQELAGLYPEFFNAEEQTNVADQLERIVDVLDELKPREINPHSQGMRQAISYLANDIIDRFFDIPQAKPTFADKAERRVMAERAKAKKKVEKAILGERIAGIRDKRKAEKKLKARIEKMSEKQKAKVLRAQITRSAGELDKRLRKATDKSHIPPELEKAVTELLYNINLESNYSYDPTTDSYKKNDKGLPTNKTKAFLKLKEIYAQMLKAEDNELSIAPELASKESDDVQNIFDKMMGAREDKITIKSDVKIADMTVEELTDVYNAIRMIEHFISSANKLFSDMKQKNLDELGKAFEKAVETRRENKALFNMSIDIETPITFFSHFGEAGNDLYNALRKAQDNEQNMIDEIAELVNGIVSSEEVKTANDKLFEFTTLGGEKLTLSKAHIMNIYLLYNRNQGKKHILYDPDSEFFGWGIIQPEIAGVLPNVPKVSKGLESVRLTKTDLGDMFSKLTDEDKAMAKKLQKATLKLAEWGNKACLEVFGYEKFKDPEYWTIKSADIVLNKDTGKSANDKTRALKNMGSAKNTDDKATNAVEIDSVFDLFAQHASDMIRYSAWLGVVEDASRLANYTFKDEAGFKTNRKFRAMLEKYAGKGGTRYYENLLKDIQNGIGLAPDTTYERVYTKLFSLAAKAKVAYKATVVAQQGMSILRASSVINPVSIMKAVGKGGLNLPAWAVNKAKAIGKNDVQASEWYGGWQRALKYAPIASRKAIGGYEINSNSSGLKDVLYKPKTKKGKAIDALKESPLWAAGKADEIAWGILWNACEFEINETTVFEKGSEEYYEEVAELFTNVINESQVVDGVLQRSQLMRSSSGWIKPLTVFKGEPTMSLNAVMRAYDNLRYEQDKAKRGKAIKKFSRTFTTFAVTAVFTAFARSLAVGGTGGDDEDYWKKVWKSFSGVQGDEETWFEYVKNVGLKSDVVNNLNPLTWLPLWSEVMSFAQGYDVERLDVASIGEFFKAGATFIDSIDDDGKNTFTYATRNLLFKFAELTGYSPLNLVKDIEGAIRTTRFETNDIKGVYDMEKWKTKPKANTSKYIDILYQAYTTNKEDYEYIYNDMIKNGVKASTIQSGMETRMKKAEGVTKSSDLTKRYMSPTTEKTYNRSLKQIKTSDVWKSANATQRKDAQADLYNYLTSTSDDMKETRAEAKAHGVDETEYTLWKLALDMIDQPKDEKGHGSYSIKEKAEAINSLELGEDEIAYFFGLGMQENGKQELDEVIDAGIDLEDYVNFKAAVSGMEADKNANGKSIPNSKKRKVVNYLNNADLTADEWNYFYYEIMNYKK
jgi:hypothetical protein